MTYPGTDAKFRITTNIPDFMPQRDNFKIVVRSRFGEVISTITKDDCFIDTESRYYFTVKSVPAGRLTAFFSGYRLDDDYDDLVSAYTDVQTLLNVGECHCNGSQECDCQCEHLVHYEQIWTASVDGGEYLCDCDGNYVYSSDGKRIQFISELTKKTSEMGKVLLNMTGDEFKRLIEEENPNGQIDTLPEVMKTLQGISDDKTVKEDTGSTYNSGNRTLYINGAKPSAAGNDNAADSGKEDI